MLMREAGAIPAAKAARDKGWKSPWPMNTWLAEAIVEYDEIRNKASKEKRSVHFGRVLPISALKGSELAEVTPAGIGKDELCSKETTSGTKIATLLCFRT